ncbi:hypothetical protein TYRP_001436 [Tyrophagus putrescentiae]|nr:hypothetical protein TYRP_001436 [Tyrophagus putrescentiae]
MSTTNISTIGGGGDSASVPAEDTKSTRSSSTTSSTTTTITTAIPTTAAVVDNQKTDKSSDPLSADQLDKAKNADDSSSSSSDEADTLQTPRTSAAAAAAAAHIADAEGAKLQRALQWRKYLVLLIIAYNLVSTGVTIFRPLQIDQLTKVDFLFRHFHSRTPEEQAVEDGKIDAVTFYEIFVGPLPFFRVYKRYITLGFVLLGLLLNSLLALVTARLVVRLMAVVGGLMLVNAFITSVLLMFISGGFAKAYETTTAALVTCLASLWLATSARGVQEGDQQLRRRSGI